MSGFEWEFFNRSRGSERKLTHREWFSSLPKWLRLAYVFVAIPAWLVIVFNVVTGNPEATSGYVAFGIFAAVALAAIINEKQAKNG